MSEIVEIKLIRGLNGDDFIDEVQAYVDEQQNIYHRQVKVDFKPLFDEKKSAILYMAFVEVRL